MMGHNMATMERFKNKTVVITGGGSGLGRQLAMNFASMGWKVAITDINEVRMQETMRLLPDGDHLAMISDAGKPEDMELLAGSVMERWGTADILINNAGTVVAGLMEEISIEDWKFQIDVNFMSVIYGCRTFIPIMKKQGGGQIVNIASAGAFTCLAEMSPYNTTKAAVITLSESIRIELKGFKIGVTAVCPSFFKTNLLESFRSPDARQRQLANNYFKYFAPCSCEFVAGKIMKAIGKNKLYCIPQPEAKLIRLMERFPSIYHNVQAFLYATGLWDKLLFMKTQKLNNL